MNGVMEYDQDFYEQLDPGIRTAVRFLHDHGFDTSDSGDGKSKPDMDCALPFAHINVIVDEVHDLIPTAGRLKLTLEDSGFIVAPVGQGGEDAGVEIQATYDPADNTSTILLLHFTIDN